MISDEEVAAYESFRDALSSTIITRLSTPRGGAQAKRKRAVKGRKTEIKPVRADQTSQQQQQQDQDANDAADLAEFIEYLAQEIFLSLPAELRSLSYASTKDHPALLDHYSLPLDATILQALVETHLPPMAIDSLSSYGLLHPQLNTTTINPDTDELRRFLEPVLTTYIETVTAPPPQYTPADAASRPAGCEICAREHLPLTYHHLVPRQVHAKAVKRGWAKEWELAKVAWLCRACHSFVHKIASNEELAREWSSVEVLVDREDVQKWAAWVGKIRWKAR